MTTISDVAAARLNVVLAELNAVYAEIARRSNSQTALITLNFTAVAAIGGVAIARHNPVLLLALPVLASTLGLLWLDHANTIREKGIYIQKDLRSLVLDLTADASEKERRLLGNEGWTSAAEQKKYWRFAANIALGVFATVSLIAIGLCVDLLILHSPSPGYAYNELHIAAIVGIVLGLALTLFYVDVARRYWRSVSAPRDVDDAGGAE